MQKFIAAFDGLKFCESTMSYAIFLTQQCNAHLVGVFLEDFTRHSYSAADITSYEGAAFDEHLQELNLQDKEERDESIELFEQACGSAGIQYSIHRDRNIALQELLHESVYGDLLLINSLETLTRYEEPVPTRFIRDLLSDVQCPVVVTPATYKPFSKICFLYDGAPSSVHAVRMFNYLFAQLNDWDMEVVTVKGSGESLHLPDNRMMKEFMKRHHPKADYTVLQGYPEDEVMRYLQKQKEEVLVVLGAYRRSRLSRLFKPSMADHLMQHLKFPLFIAHNKS